MPDSFRLDGDVALITGGGTGLGYAVAAALIAAGARVAITGRREDVLARAAGELGNGVRYFVHDVRDQRGTAALMDRIDQELGPLTILVNNAGVHLKKPALETNSEEFRSVLDTHVQGAFHLAIASVPHMRRAGRGSILFMTSMTAFIGMTNVVAYSAAKSAYLGMVRALAAELSPEGIRVNAIAPGWIESPMLRRALDGDPERQRRILARTPMGRFGRPEDIGWAATFLCSPAANFITGAVLPVDGGASSGF